MPRLVVFLLLVPLVASAAGSASLKAFSNGQVADATDVNANFAALATTLDGFDGVTRKCPNGATQTFSGATWTWSSCPTGIGTGANATDPATSCKAIKDAYPASGSGFFWLNKPGAPDLTTVYETYCDMSTDGGGWTLVLNLNTNDATTRDYDDATWWTGTAPVGTARNLAADVKSRSFTDVTVATELMIVAHQDGTAVVLGSARYDLLPIAQNKSLHTLFNTLNNVAITPVRKAVSGAVGTNGARTAGDAFVDNPHPVIVNSRYSPLDSDNYTRLGTNYSDRCSTISCDGHNYGGIGGRHFRVSWGAYYEGAQLNGYCSTFGAYGTNGRAYNGNNAFLGQSSGCTSQSSKSVDYMVFVR